MNRQKIIYQKKLKRAKKVHTKIKALTSKPRLSVFRSNQYIYAQIINDQLQKTLVSASSLEIKKNQKTKATKTELAKMVGKLVAEKALKANIKNVVFDRGKYKYHGRVKALAEGAREGGLIF